MRTRRAFFSVLGSIALGLSLLFVPVAQAGSFNFVNSFGSNGTGDGQFQFPTAIAVDSSGNIYVTDDTRLQEFTSSGTFIRTIGFGNYNEPIGVALDSSNNIYVSNYASGGVQEYNQSGTYLRTIPTGGYPYGVVITSNDHIYAENGPSGSEHIQEFTNSGTALQNFGNPFGAFMVVDQSGNLYSPIRNANLIREFDKNGNEVREISSKYLNAPYGIAMDKNGNIFVANYGSTTVSEFSSSGSFIQNIGTGILSTPYNVAFDNNGNLLVADAGNNRIVEFTDSSAQSVPEPGSGASALLGLAVLLIGAVVRDRKNKCLQAASAVGGSH
jgi:tripartite motif-containing protein 71